MVFLLPFLSVNYDFVDHLGCTLDPGHGFLGDLLFVEAKQAPPQEKNAILALTRDSSQGSVWAVSQTLPCRLCNFAEIVTFVTDHRTT